jgi:hypothetical protein
MGLVSQAFRKPRFLAEYHGEKGGKLLSNYGID